MGVDRQPTDGLEVIPAIFCPDAVVADDAVFLQKVHYLDLIDIAVGDPIFQLIFHFGLMMSLNSLSPTTRTAM